LKEPQRQMSRLILHQRATLAPTAAGLGAGERQGHGFGQGRHLECPEILLYVT
jgi:hypothetical protein